MRKHTEPEKNNLSKAADFITDLKGNTNLPQSREAGEPVLSVRMRDIFALAKKHMHMAGTEIEKLLESPVFEHRVGAVSIMDWKARNKKTTASERKALFDLYLRRHDCINDWSLVDRCAPYVVGGYLEDKPRDILYELASSKNLWERRTAIVSTYYFIRNNDLETTFDIAAILIEDGERFVQMAVGGWIREAGKKDQSKLIRFLDIYCPIMPPLMLRYAVEHLDKQQREKYLNYRKESKQASVTRQPVGFSSFEQVER